MGSRGSKPRFNVALRVRIVTVPEEEHTVMLGDVVPLMDATVALSRPRKPWAQY